MRRLLFGLRFLFPAGLLATLMLVLFWDVLLGGRRLFFGDLGWYFVPLLHLERETLLSGHLALWNPRILWGTPLWGNPQAFPLYPSSLLLWVLPASQAVGVIAAFHIWLASWGTFLFLRRRELGQSAALFGAIAWGMGGAVVSKAQFPNMIQAAAFLPFLLLAVENVVTNPRAKSAAFLGVIVGFALLAAHPQIFLMAFYLGAAWAIFRLRGTEPAQKRKVAAWLFVGVILGLGLASAQLLPTVELVRASVRTQLTIAQANRFILPPYAVLTNFIAPNFYGNPATSANYVGRGNFWEPCAFMGILPFGFALWAGVRLFRSTKANNADVRFWAVVALLGVWLALGKDAGLWVVAFWLVPGVAKFHDAARWLIVGTWGIACLAAWGLDAFLRLWNRAFVRRLWAAGMIGFTAWQVISFGRTLNPTTPARIWQTVENPPNRASNGRTYFADESKAWGHWISYKTYRNLQTDAQVQKFLSSQTPNTNVFASQNDANGYEPVRRTNVNALLEGLHKQEGKTFALGITGITRITRLDKNFVPFVQAVPGAKGRAVFTENETNLSISLRVVDLSPQRVLVRLPIGHNAGTVVLSDTAHPGWTAQIDNRKQQTPLSSGAFRAVRVGKNEKSVLFDYSPASVRVGLFLSLSAAGILTAITVGERRRKNVAEGGTRARSPIAM